MPRFHPCIDKPRPRNAYPHHGPTDEMETCEMTEDQAKKHIKEKVLPKLRTLARGWHLSFDFPENRLSVAKHVIDAEIENVRYEQRDVDGISRLAVFLD